MQLQLQHQIGASMATIREEVTGRLRMATALISSFELPLLVFVATDPKVCICGKGVAPLRPLALQIITSSTNHLSHL
ncbi:hypothetical protein DdX_14460 [Ditylenchus destructor]|uniref:Uncharacterized protein n=1 Tax=Ditylenchus destructor TaxID=166010 RepID=A0AAD4MU51_9BILA|nr:hypothetical protein DdX_14460 [Ditylenchus destructor]